MHRRLAFVILFSLLIAMPGMSLAGKVSRGTMLANSCAGCHGEDGKSPGAIPRIAGKSAGYIEQTMKDFASGKRAATVMGRHALGYTDEEIKLIAKYFASQQ